MSEELSDSQLSSCEKSQCRRPFLTCSSLNCCSQRNSRVNWTGPLAISQMPSRRDVTCDSNECGGLELKSKANERHTNPASGRAKNGGQSDGAEEAEKTHPSCFLPRHNRNMLTNSGGVDGKWFPVGTHGEFDKWLYYYHSFSEVINQTEKL